MATYVYETLPRSPADKPRRFEVVQSMKDAPLTRHPDTGELVRRVITGGYGLMGVGTRNAPEAPACAPGCACHNGKRDFVPPCADGGGCACDA
jgi:hypothetical protein